MIGSPIVGAPGVSTTNTTAYRRAFYQPMQDIWLAGGRTIAGAYSRDPGSGVPTVLRAGLLLGKRSSDGYYAPSGIGLTGEALDSTETVLTVSEAVGDEIVRRIGASGTFKLTGPPTAAGTVRTSTITYSAVAAAGGGNRDITITAPGVDEVQTVIFGAAATGGTFKIGFTLSSGAVVWTDTIAWSDADATFLASMNTAIGNILGASLVVATARPAVDTDLGFVLTFSGAGYTALPQSLVAIDVSALTSVSTATVTRTTTGTDGRFVTSSLIQPTDGSETPITFVPDGYGIQVADWAGNNVLAQNHKVAIAGSVDFAQLLPAVADASLKTWVKNTMKDYGNFVFSSDY